MDFAFGKNLSQKLKYKFFFKRNSFVSLLTKTSIIKRFKSKNVFKKRVWGNVTKYPLTKLIKFYMYRFLKFKILSTSDAKLYAIAPRLGKGTSPLHGPVVGSSGEPSPKRTREAENIFDEFSSVKGEDIFYIPPISRICILKGNFPKVQGAKTTIYPNKGSVISMFFSFKK